MGGDAGVVLSEQRGAVLVLTLNRPDRLNAWTRQMETRYFDLLDDADDDPTVRAIVVTGAGRGFCPGMDAESLTKATVAGPSKADRRPMTHALTARKPLIAAINGACAGIGLVQALVSDVRFVAAGAKLATSFTRRGLQAEFSTSWLLPRLVGYGVATDLLISGRTILAEEAHRLGLVNEIVPGEHLMERALDYARDLVENCSPVAMADVKAQIADDWDQSQEASFAAALEITDRPGRNIDFREGVISYVEKRPPAFRPLPPKGVPLDSWPPQEEPAT